MIFSCYYSNFFNFKQSFELHEFGGKHNKTSWKLSKILTKSISQERLGSKGEISTVKHIWTMRKKKMIYAEAY